MKKQQGSTTLQTIGIAGIDRGNGVTHLAIMLGNYITAKLHKNTAILEMNSSHAFLELKECYGEEKGKKQEPDYFRISKVSYYNDVTYTQIYEICSMNYDYIILDMGSYDEVSMEEFLKCTIKILIGNLSPWKSRKFVCAIESLAAYEEIKKIKYLIKSGTEDYLYQIEKAYQINIFQIVNESDPFLIHGCNFEFLDYLIQ